jgi:hypothetical protein
LGNSASKHEIESAFSKYGTLRNVWVARNPPGFAFVEYQDNRDAEDAGESTKLQVSQAIPTSPHFQFELLTAPASVAPESESRCPRAAPEETKAAVEAAVAEDHAETIEDHAATEDVTGLASFPPLLY